MSRKRITYGGVSEDAVFLFRFGLLLERRNERNTDRFREVDKELTRELGLRPWHPSVFDVTGGVEDDNEILASARPDHRAFYAHWRDDLVAFVIGCSFSFEHALMADGLTIRHIEQGCNVPMYRTNVPCAPAGLFAGPLVVSMRPFNPADAIRAIQITTRFPAVHGAPVHFGDPAQIGISDIARPDYGNAVTIRPDEVPVFWACGVTPQSIILQSRPDFAITHAPGCMLVTDRRISEFAIQ
jgi:hypothetical protein